MKPLKRLTTALLTAVLAVTSLHTAVSAEEYVPEDNTDWEQYVNDSDLVNQTDSVECPYRVFYEENGATLRKFHAANGKNYKPFSVLYLGGITKTLYDKYMKEVSNNNPFSVDIMFSSEVGSLYLYSTCSVKYGKTVQSPGAYVDSNYSIQITASLEPFELDGEMIYAFTIYDEGLDDLLTEQVQRAKEIIAASSACTVYVQSGDEIVDPYGHIGEYTAPVTAYFKPDIASLTVSETAQKKYKGLPVEPTVTVKDVNTYLTEGIDYTVKYSSNDGVGLASLTINGKGYYTGSVTKTFRIVPKTVGIKAVVKGSKVKLKWGTAEDIDRYIIYRSDDGGKTYKRVYRAKPTTKSVVLKRPDGECLYRVRSVKKVDGKNYYSEYSKPVEVK